MLTEATASQVNAALQRNDLTEAANVAAAAVASGESHVILFKLAALRCDAQGEYREAARLQMCAAALDPADALTLTAAGDALRAAGQLREALVLFDRALALQDDLLPTVHGRGLTLEASGLLDAARSAFAHVVTLDPDGHHGLAALAAVSAKLGDTAQARTYAQDAQERAPGDPGVAMALAHCDMQDRDFAAAAKRLDRLCTTTDMHPRDRVAAQTLLGDALDGLDDVDGAFAAYTAANECFAQMAARDFGGEPMRVRIGEMTRAVQKLTLQARPQSSTAAQAGVRNHVFLLGHPRSGTTLVEQALLSLPDVVATEEAPTFADAERYLSADGIGQLSSLGDDERDALRAAYWQRVSAEGVDVAGKTFVDMDPSKSVALPVIAALFPEAKIVLMQRDPRDVVWSCFRRAFSLNAVTSQFTTIESTAAHYASVMAFVAACKQHLALQIEPLVYEDIVEDFDGAMRRLCDVVGVPWSRDMRDFGATARRLGVKTASAGQVRKNLFDGNGQWHRYADRLKPVLPVLEPWIAR